MDVLKLLRLLVIYVVLLLITRELGSADLATVKAVLARKARPAPAK